MSCLISINLNLPNGRILITKYKWPNWPNLFCDVFNENVSNDCETEFNKDALLSVSLQGIDYL